jgi:hypothetical protein
VLLELIQGLLLNLHWRCGIFLIAEVRLDFFIVIKLILVTSGFPLWFLFTVLLLAIFLVLLRPVVSKSVDFFLLSFLLANFFATFRLRDLLELPTPLNSASEMELVRDEKSVSMSSYFILAVIQFLMSIERNFSATMCDSQHSGSFTLKFEFEETVTRSSGLCF